MGSCMLRFLKIWVFQFLAAGLLPREATYQCSFVIPGALNKNGGLVFYLYTYLGRTFRLFSRGEGVRGRKYNMLRLARIDFIWRGFTTLVLNECLGRRILKTQNETLKIKL